MSTLVTAVVVCLVFTVLNIEARQTARALVFTQLEKSQRVLSRIQQRSFDDLLWIGSITAENPSLRAAIETYWPDPAGSPNGGRPPNAVNPVARITIHNATRDALEALGRDAVIVTDGVGRPLGHAFRGRPVDSIPALGGIPAVAGAIDQNRATGVASFAVASFGGTVYRIGVVPIELRGYPIGALILGEELSRVVDSLAAALDGLVVVTGASGVLATGGVPAGDSLSAELRAALRDTVPRSAIEVDGEELAVATLPLGTDDTGKPVTLHLLHSVDPVLAEADRRLALAFLGYGLLAVVMVGVGAGLLARSITRPFVRFVKFLRQVGQSKDYGSRFELGTDIKEIRSLKETYDGMIESLAKQHSALLRQTNDLAKANTELIHQIEEREQAERALATSEAKLRQAQKLEAIGTLAGGVAHDFNNLLTVILGNTSMLIDNGNLSKEDVEDLGQVKEAADRAAQLTQQLLTFGRKQVTQPKPLDLVTVVIGVKSLLSRLIGEHIVVSAVFHENEAWIVADPTQIEQVIINLAINARDAMPHGGTLTIVVGRSRPAPSASQTHPGDWIVLSVADSGVGMDQATQERIFEPFFTTKSLGKGTGLGLSTVYGIVQQAGGQISVASELGRGTTFEILLPGTAARPERMAPSGGDEKTLGGGEIILIAEDEHPVRAFAARVLERAGYRVLQASDGQEALAMASELQALDLLLTDVIMPGMSGGELHRQLAAKRPGLKTLYMSGYPDDTVNTHGRIRSGFAFVQKPFQDRELLTRVRRLLDSPEVYHAK